MQSQHLINIDFLGQLYNNLLVDKLYACKLRHLVKRKFVTLISRRVSNV